MRSGPATRLLPRTRRTHPLHLTALAPLVVLALVLAAAAADDPDGDGDYDRDDLDILIADLGSTVEESACGAPCDLDGDGVITPLDARQLTLLCAPDSGCEVAVCGDGRVTPPEQCDGDDAACGPGSVCSAACLCEEVDSCGDGVVTGSEECETDLECGPDLVCSDCVCDDATADTITRVIDVRNFPAPLCQGGPRSGQVCGDASECSFCVGELSQGAPCELDSDCPEEFCEVTCLPGPTPEEEECFEECFPDFGTCEFVPCASQLRDDPVYSWRQCPTCGASSFDAAEIDPVIPPEPPDPVGGICQFIEIDEFGATIGVNRIVSNGGVCCAWQADCSTCGLTTGVEAFQWVGDDVTTSGFAVSDSDDFPDFCDNCPDWPNTDQADDDLDGVGNLCDPDWLPEPGGIPGLLAGAAALAALARRRRARAARLAGPLAVVIAVLATGALLPGSARAATIALVPSAGTAPLEGTLDVALTIEGLGDPGTPSLGVYQVEVLFDPQVLSLSGVVFGDPLLGNQLDLGGFGSATLVSEAPGSVVVFEVSVDAAALLDASQAGAFTLATLGFDAVGLGSSALTPNVLFLGDADGLDLAATAHGSGVAVVPEPSAWLLFPIGLLLLHRQSGRHPARAPAGWHTARAGAG